MSSRIGSLALALVCGAFFTGCFLDLSREDECIVDGDCPTGEVCDGGLLANVCRVPCGRHADCGDGEYCALDVFSSGAAYEAYCSNGCATDADCDAGRRCIAGRCDDEACSIDSDCPSGEVCHPLLLACLPGCRSDAECGSGSRCARAPGAAATCSRSGCSTDEDCLDGRSCICGGCAFACASDDDCEGSALCVTGGEICPTRRCASSNPATAIRVACGAALCESVAEYPDGEWVSRSACCADPVEGVCGFQSLLGDWCEVQSPLPVADPTCGEGACCAADGYCGLAVNLLLGEDAGPVACGALSGAGRVPCDAPR